MQEKIKRYREKCTELDVKIGDLPLLFAVYTYLCRLFKGSELVEKGVLLYLDYVTIFCQHDNIYVKCSGIGVSWFIIEEKK